MSAEHPSFFQRSKRLAYIPQRVKAMARDGSTSRLWRGTAWLSVGVFFGRGANLLGMTLVARLLGSEDFGAIGVLQGAVVLFGVLGAFALGSTSSRFVAEWRHVAPERAGRLIGLAYWIASCLGGLASLVLVVGAPTLAASVFHRPDLAPSLAICAVLVFFASLNSAQTGALAGFEAFRQQARVQALSGCATAVLVVLGAYCGSLQGYVGCWILSQGLTTVYAAVVLRRVALANGVRLQFTGINVLNFAPHLLGHSLPLLIGSLIVAPVHLLTQSFLSANTDGYHQLGLLNAAGTWSNALLFFPALIGQVTLPVIASQLRLDGRAAWAAIRVPLVGGLLLVIPSGLMMLLSDRLLSISGPAYSEGAPVLVALAVTATLLAIQFPLLQLLYAANWAWATVVSYALWAALFLDLGHRWADHGALGIAHASVIAHAVHVGLTGLFCAVWFKRNSSRHSQSGT